MQEQIGNSSGVWQAFSQETASAITQAARAVVAVHGGRRIPASGVHWGGGIIVTVDHAVEHDDELNVTLPGGERVAAKLAGRDPSTDLAILRIDAGDLPVAQLAETASFAPGQFVLAAACTAEGGPRAALALISVVAPASRTWRGGTLDQTLRLDRNLHPNFSGGPAIDEHGRVLGINTSGLSRFAGVIVPVATVKRVVAELDKKGHIGRGYLGVGMAPVALPEAVRDSLKLSTETGIMLMAVEPDSPAAKAGLLLGDIFVAFEGKPLRGLRDVQSCLTSERIGKSLAASIIRGGKLVNVTVTVGEKPAAN